MISKQISIDILHFLLETKNLSKEEISKIIDISINEINNILNNKSSLTPEHIQTLLKNLDIRWWELMDEAVQPEYLTEHIKNKISLCKALYKRLKK